MAVTCPRRRWVSDRGCVRPVPELTRGIGLSLEREGGIEVSFVHLTVDFGVQVTDGSSSLHAPLPRRQRRANQVQTRSTGTMVRCEKRHIPCPSVSMAA
jgi:hypothetical protein